MDSMTLSEFRAWLDGYIAAGGDDMMLIKAKMDCIHEPAPSIRPLTPYRSPSVPDLGSGWGAADPANPLDPWWVKVYCDGKITMSDLPARTSAIDANSVSTA